MMYALVKILGKQYRVEKGSLIRVDLLKGKKKDDRVEFDTVMMLSSDKGPRIGRPYVKGVRVLGTVGELVRGAKVEVIKFKRRKGYHRFLGHRQNYSLIRVDEIVG